MTNKKSSDFSWHDCKLRCIRDHRRKQKIHYKALPKEKRSARLRKFLFYLIVQSNVLDFRDLPQV